jgi:hypothetical protein
MFPSFVSESVRGAILHQAIPAILQSSVVESKAADILLSLLKLIWGVSPNTSQSFHPLLLSHINRYSTSNTQAMQACLDSLVSVLATTKVLPSSSPSKSILAKPSASSPSKKRQADTPSKSPKVKKAAM